VAGSQPKDLGERRLMRSAHEISKSLPNLGWWALLGLAAILSATYATFVILNLLGLR
jgi:hypothetical protein